MTRLPFYTVLFLMILMPGCEKEETHGFTVSGYVTTNGTVVENAIVSLANSRQDTVYTDQNGYFMISNVKAGTYILNAKKPNAGIQSAFSASEKTIEVTGDLQIEGIDLPRSIEFFDPKTEGTEAYKKVTLSWRKFTGDTFQKYQLLKSSSDILNDSDGEVVYTTENPNDTTFSIDLPYGPTTFFRILARGGNGIYTGTRSLAVTGRNIGLKYELFVYDAFDSSALENVMVLQRWCTHPDIDMICGHYILGCTDKLGYFSKTALPDELNLQVLGAICPNPFPMGNTYTSPYTEYVSNQNKVTKIYLTTYSSLLINFEKVNTYANEDSLFLFVDNVNVKKYRCNDDRKYNVFQKVLAHQYHKIEWKVKKAAVMTSFQESVFCDPLKDYRYTLKF